MKRRQHIGGLLDYTKIIGILLISMRQGVILSFNNKTNLSPQKMRMPQWWENYQVLSRERLKEATTSPLYLPPWLFLSTRGAPCHVPHEHRIVSHSGESDVDGGSHF